MSFEYLKPPLARCLAVIAAFVYVLSLASISMAAQSLAGEHTLAEPPANQQTVSGRLTCAHQDEASYNCGHSKNEPVWGCTLRCAKASDGSQYVLQTSDRIYFLSGDAKKLRHFAANDVVVSGELSGQAIKVSSIAKAPQKTAQNDLPLQSHRR